MTYPRYSHQQLQLKSIARLKQIYSEMGCTVEVNDKRCKDAWISAILTHQSAQLQKIDNQALAQAELDQYITAQAEAIAPEELTTIEISFYDHEIFCGKELIASITYDNDLTQPWLVMVDGKEKFRANTWAICYRFIQWHLNNSQLPNRKSQLNSIPEGKEFVSGINQSPHHIDNCELQTANCELLQDGTLNPSTSEEVPEVPSISFYDQEAFVEPCTTGNEIMAVIFNECEKYGLELLDDGIYRNDEKLGEVGCTDGHWWAIRTGGNQGRVVCDCAMDAVWWLSITETSSTTNKYLQDRPLEQLTSAELEQLFATAV
ncbi:MAG: hypothetical protein MET45_21535 [Nostoc sp. LLA-1]|nr:hypothetical protein [Cyanocohniella sp. LLY]